MLEKIRNNCKRATFLIDKNNLDRINLIQQIELHIHLAGCSFCRLYGKQSLAINNLIRQLKQNELPDNVRLNEEYKKALEQSISVRLKKK